MRNIPYLLAILVAAFFVRAAVAQDFPQDVRKVLDTIVKDCRANDGKPGDPQKAVTSADLNGDGQPDFVIDYGAVECDGAASLYCGTGGCTHDILVSHDGRYVQAWSDNIHGWKTIKVRGKPGIQFDLHGSACGKAGAAPCSKRFVFSAGKLVPAK